MFFRTEEDYALMKSWLSYGVTIFLPEGSRAGLMQFSTRPSLEFHLTEDQSGNESTKTVSVWNVYRRV